jgi:hypothetical protein
MVDLSMMMIKKLLLMRSRGRAFNNLVAAHAYDNWVPPDEKREMPWAEFQSLSPQREFNAICGRPIHTYIGNA